MKKLLFLLIGVFFILTASAQIDTVNTGSFPGAGDGDKGYVAFGKVNQAIKQVNSNTDSITQFSTEINANAQGISDNSVNINYLSVRIDSNGARLDTVFAITDTLQAEIDTVNDRIDSNAAAIANVNQLVIIDSSKKVYSLKKDNLLKRSIFWDNADSTFKYYLDTIRSADILVYLSTTGNDVTGDGSSGNPVATIKRAAEIVLQNATTFVNCRVELVFQTTGTYNWDLNTRDVFRGFTMLQNTELRFSGIMTVQESGFTPSKLSGYYLGHQLTKAGRTFVKNDLVGTFANAAYPVGYNTAGSTTCNVFYTSTSNYSSYSVPGVIIQDVSGDPNVFSIDFANREPVEVRFRSVKLVSSGDIYFKGSAFIYFQQTCAVECVRMIIGDPDNVAIGYPVKVAFRRSMLTATSTASGLELRAAGTQVYFLDFVLYAPNALNYKMTIDNTSTNGFYNCIVGGNVNSPGIRLGDKCNISASIYTSIDNYSAFEIEYSGVNWINARASDLDSRLDMVGTDYIYYVRDLTRLPSLFRMELNQVYAEPSFEYYANARAQFIKPEHAYFAVIDGSSPEIETGNEFTLTDNTSSFIPVGNNLYNSFVVFEASFTRGVQTANAIIKIDPETLAFWVDWYPSNASLGLTFDSIVISSGVIQLHYTTTSTGDDIDVKGNFKRVMR